MARAFGLSITPWAPLAGGALTGKYLQGETGRVAENSARRNERSPSIVREVVAVAQEIGCTPAQAAVRWTMQRPDGHVVPRTVAQMQDSLGATEVRLSEEQVRRLDKVSTIELGFPHDFLASDAVQDVLFGGTRALLDV
ncbi:aldo/keto reductase [Hymenobacter weizhouensis]|uniref:aldo/keto reductase n=1 Tax=Hymenobacter sp. YIM 151500-1 TaxID=2987689 RepID=UPI002227E2E3|nr:aldo/keto reductase [Hymenobacter sp. YIM 151500-1]UYZ62277.1 aldo/keto reductase [Hymenobacter sp. YIM 151500-1]